MSSVSFFESEDANAKHIVVGRFIAGSEYHYALYWAEAASPAARGGSQSREAGFAGSTFACVSGAGPGNTKQAAAHRRGDCGYR